MMEGCRIHVVRPDGRVLDAASGRFELDGARWRHDFAVLNDTLSLPERARTVRFATSVVHYKDLLYSKISRQALLPMSPCACYTNSMRAL